MAEQTPIIVTDNTLEGQVSTLLRYLVAAGGAFALGKGWIDDATLQALTALVTVAAPMAWGIWRTYSAKRKLIKAALFAPNDIAQVVHK
ncbi:hypothetical protein C7451_106163 [Blastomonas natatoria]|uniref:Holin n=1 Tax=Blastomonas natatoria TaxID=34015 RepID=A0A2V3VH95_9SPHN|nr:hypothetical protein [Blastomonas natatoria]PXW75999.1 hypothetical protein C7451_106163 [Blastomonas natatoria]